jgi:hypothetical protein
MLCYRNVRLEVICLGGANNPRQILIGELLKRKNCRLTGPWQRGKTTQFIEQTSNRRIDTLCCHEGGEHAQAHRTRRELVIERL